MLCLASNLLLLNQFPDIDADRAVGRVNVLIRYGPVTAHRVYATGGIVAYGLLGALIATAGLPLAAAIALTPAALSLTAWRGMAVHGIDVGEHPGYLAANAAAAVLTPALLAAALWWAT